MKFIYLYLNHLKKNRLQLKCYNLSEGQKKRVMVLCLNGAYMIFTWELYNFMKRAEDLVRNVISSWLEFVMHLWIICQALSTR